MQLSCGSRVTRPLLAVIPFSVSYFLTHVYDTRLDPVVSGGGGGMQPGSARFTIPAALVGQQASPGGEDVGKKLEVRDRPSLARV